MQLLKDCAFLALTFLALLIINVLWLCGAMYAFAYVMLLLA